MIPPERLSDRPVSIRPSRRRAPARNDEVCSKSINDRDNARANARNRYPLRTRTASRVAQIVVPSPCKLQSGQLAAIEIP